MATSTSKSSFEKKIKVNQIPGARPSLANNQLLVSTGVPSLDALIGGGLAVGTVLLIEEDRFANYSSLMMKLYLADACTNNNEVFLACNDISPQSILANLPCPVTYDPPEESQTKSKTGDESTGDGLHIAWRYQNLKIEKSAGKPSFGLYFDVTKTIDAEVLKNVNTTVFSSDTNSSSSSPESNKMGSSYNSLLQEINSKITEGKFSTSSQNEKRNILRIGIQSLGSPLWDTGLNSLCESPDHSRISLYRFLYALRSILRTSYATCIITMPTHLFQIPQAYIFVLCCEQDLSSVSRIRNLCDSVVRLESFADSAVSGDSTFKDYHGLFHVIKTPGLNSLSRSDVDTDDLVFKLRRKRFTIEKLHLPPALESSADSEAVKKSRDLTLEGSSGMSMGCNTGLSGHSSHLDF